MKTICIVLIALITISSVYGGQYQVCTKLPDDQVIWDIDTLDYSIVQGHNKQITEGNRHEKMLLSNVNGESNYMYQSSQLTFSEIIGKDDYSWSIWLNFQKANENDHFIYISSQYVQVKSGWITYQNKQVYEIQLNEWVHIVFNQVNGKLDIYHNAIKTAEQFPSSKFSNSNVSIQTDNIKVKMEGWKVFKRSLTYEEILCLGDTCPTECYSTCQLGVCDPAPEGLSDPNVPYIPSNNQISLTNFDTTGLSVSENTVTLKSDQTLEMKKDSFFYEQFTLFFEVTATTEGEILRYITDNKADEDTLDTFKLLTGFRLNIADGKLIFEIDQNETKLSTNFVLNNSYSIVLMRFIDIADHKAWFYLYLNGEKVGQVQDVLVGFDFFSSFSFGKPSNTEINFGDATAFTGDISEIKIFWRPMKIEEIQLLASPCETRCVDGSSYCNSKSDVCPEKLCPVLYSNCGLKGEKGEYIVLCEKQPDINMYVKSVYIPDGMDVTLYTSTDFSGYKANYSKSQECFTEALNFKFFEIGQKVHLTKNLRKTE